jgi:hypothetical protein
MGDPGVLKIFSCSRCYKGSDGIGNNSLEVFNLQGRYLYGVIALIRRRHDSPPFEILNGV